MSFLLPSKGFIVISVFFTSNFYSYRVFYRQHLWRLAVAAPNDFCEPHEFFLHRSRNWLPLVEFLLLITNLYPWYTIRAALHYNLLLIQRLFSWKLARGCLNLSLGVILRPAKNESRSRILLPRTGKFWSKFFTTPHKVFFHFSWPTMLIRKKPLRQINVVSGQNSACSLLILKCRWLGPRTI